MRPILLRKLDFTFQHIKNFIQCLQFLGLVQKTLQVFLELLGESKLFHTPMDLSIASTLDVSIGPSVLPALASSIACRVTSLGS